MEQVLPAYLRIATHFAREIEAGRLSQGEKIGPERALAEQFGVNRGTVRAALRHLREQRLVVTDSRGTYVTTPEHQTAAIIRQSAAPALEVGSGGPQGVRRDTGSGGPGE
ncbi:GntR family transcriptional regulator [Streptomyces sp. NPDC051664]|uniref:GntR family transcriptional regulator n=1 Tax=Streptomyces sp. NPDC051664 TaxID=3365668 RepID=UPI00379E3283